VPQCKSCGEEADELVQVEINGRKKRLCESCAEQANEQQSILEASEAAVQNMMGFRGRR
jgi:ribosome-binding protein aMBF1 (putative translation factor)